jgi:membrane protein
MFKFLRRKRTPEPASRSAAKPGAQSGDKTPKASQQTDLAGTQAEKPTQIPAKGWKQIAARAWKESKADNVPMLAGGVAFFGFLALFPALIATMTIYGLMVSPSKAREQVNQYASALPGDSRKILSDQVAAVAQGNGKGLGIGLVISILLALWSASGGMGNLIKAVNIAYDEEETRGFVKLRATALMLTIGAVIFVLVALALVAVVPAILNHLNIGIVGAILANIARFVVLALAVAVALAVVYRVAPDRDSPKLSWASLGAVVSTVLWIIGSVAFSIYVSNFGKYNKTYGAVAGVAILMLWLYLTSYIVLFGAEVNAEAEQQTVKDTTKGPAQPIGQRGAVAADSMPGGSA